MNYRTDSHWSHSAEGSSYIKIVEQLWIETSLAPQCPMEPNIPSSSSSSPLLLLADVSFCSAPSHSFPSAILITREGEKWISLQLLLKIYYHVKFMACIFITLFTSGLPWPSGSISSPSRLVSICLDIFVDFAMHMDDSSIYSFFAAWIYQPWCHWPAPGTRLHDRFCI